MREMQLLPEWFLKRHLGLELGRGDPACSIGCSRRLAHAALEQPAVFVHRDYHSRNLLVTRDDNPGIIDFQDAVMGPVTYDVVSLLKDCYIAWPRGARARLGAGAPRAALLAADSSRRASANFCAASISWGCSGTSRCSAFSRACSTATASPSTCMTCRACSPTCASGRGLSRERRVPRLPRRRRWCRALRPRSGGRSLTRAGRGDDPGGGTRRAHAAAHRHRPKPLLLARGQPLIERHVEALVAAGIARIVINLAWLGAQIRAHLGDGARYGARISYSEERARALETAGGIIHALPHLRPGPLRW